MDPPEPRNIPARGAAAEGRKRAEETRERMLEIIKANGGAATQGQLRRVLGLSCGTLLGHLHRLHGEGAIIRAGFDNNNNRSIIWKLAPPAVVLRRTTQLRCPRNGEGPLRVLDAVDALGGRASQAELARILGLDSETVRGHCLTLEADGHLARGGLDKSTSRRGSQVWSVPPSRARYNVGRGGGYTMRLAVPR
jgi:DNA-binding Lrp family transcriptional regulator